MCEKRLQQMLSEDCSPLLQEVIKECRAYQPSEQPSVDKILEKLSAFTDSV